MGAALACARQQTPIASVPDSPATRAASIRHVGCHSDGVGLRTFAIDFNARRIKVRFDLEYGAWFAASRQALQYFHADAQGMWHARCPPARQERLSLDAQCDLLTALGYHHAIQAPVVPPDEVRRAIPRVVHQLWIDETVPDGVVERLRHNACQLRQSSPSYALCFHVLCEKENFTAIARRIREEAPDVVVRCVRRSQWFKAFVSGQGWHQFLEAKRWAPRFVQYDVLRYPLLLRHGGILLDITDPLRPGGVTLPERMAQGDVFFSRMVDPFRAGQHADMDVGCMASLPGNPTVGRVIESSFQNWRNLGYHPNISQALAESPGDVTPVYQEHLSAISGPRMVTNAVCEARATLRIILDLYEAAEDGIVLSESWKARFADAMQYYFPFDGVLQAHVSANMRREVTPGQARTRPETRPPV
ncbi:hypothetical protein [Pandoraea terrae]|nr:hypothetical protein [Pandoraea terrae]